MLATPCHGTQETFMTLIGTYDKNIKFHFLHYCVNITIFHNTVNISYTLNHIHAFLCAIDKFAFRLVLQHNIRTLYGYYKIISNFPGTAEQFHMTYVQQIVNANSKNSFHHLIVSCKVTTLFEKHKI